MFTRKTSAYLILITTQGDPHALLDEMVARCPKDVEQTAKYTGMAGLRFRCETDDHAALNVALEIAAGREFRLFTGYGTHQREIAQ